MSNRRGFTLIELLIVVVIIGILAAIAIPKFATTKDKAKLASVKTDLRNLMTAQEAYFSDQTAYASLAQITGVPYNYTLSAGNTGSATGGTSGWVATFSNPSISTATNRQCTVTVGNGAAANVDGVIVCS